MWVRACKAQGFDRSKLVYKAWLTPYSAYIPLVGTLVMAFVGGYTVFLPGSWDLPSFFFSYTMIGVFPLLFITWKLVKKTRLSKPHDIDLYPREMAEIDAHEANYVSQPARQFGSFFLQISAC